MAIAPLATRLLIVTQWSSSLHLWVGERWIRTCYIAVLCSGVQTAEKSINVPLSLPAHTHLGISITYFWKSCPQFLTTTNFQRQFWKRTRSVLSKDQHAICLSQNKRLWILKTSPLYSMACKPLDTECLTGVSVQWLARHSVYRTTHCTVGCCYILEKDIDVKTYKSYWYYEVMIMS